MATCELARGPRNATLSIPGRNVYQVEYLFTADATNWGAKKVIETGQTLTAPNDPLPYIYSTYAVSGDTADTAAYCLSISATRNTEKKTLWTCVANFGPLPIGRLTGDNTSNPMLRPTKYTMEYVATTEPVTQAVNITALPHRPAGNLGPIESAAAEEFDETLYETRFTPVLVMRKNYATLTEVHDIVRTYDGTLNSDSYFGYPRECAKFEGVELSDPITEGAYTYWEATIRVALSRKPFYRSVVNQGFRYLNNGDAVEATDANGDRVSAPVLLAADGTKLADGQLGNLIDYRTQDLVSYGGLVL